MVYSDASYTRLGCALMQEGVAADASMKLKVHEQNYTAHDLELAVVLFTLKIWRHYIYVKKCVMYFLTHVFSYPERIEPRVFF